MRVPVASLRLSTQVARVRDGRRKLSKIAFTVPNRAQHKLAAKENAIAAQADSDDIWVRDHDVDIP